MPWVLLLVLSAIVRGCIGGYLDSGSVHGPVSFWGRYGGDRATVWATPRAEDHGFAKDETCLLEDVLHSIGLVILVLSGEPTD